MRIRRDNQRLRNENHILRCGLKNFERNPYSECRDVLKAVSAYCLDKYQSSEYRKEPYGPPYICPDESCLVQKEGKNKSQNNSVQLDLCE